MKRSKKAKSVKDVKGIKILKKTENIQIRGGLQDIVIVDVEA